jgi:hypothetical protein
MVREVIVILSAFSLLGDKLRATWHTASLYMVGAVYCDRRRDGRDVTG